MWMQCNDKNVMRKEDTKGSTQLNKGQTKNSSHSINYRLGIMQNGTE